jgi:hypothetical protein
MTYLKLIFRNAGLYRTHRKTKDRIIASKYSGSDLRKSQPNFKEPITYHQISNVIHSLFGERPVPHFRNTIHKPILKYVDKAKKSYLILNYTHKIIKGENVRYEELSTIRKLVWNSFNKNESLDWFKVITFLGQNLLDEFITYSNEIFSTNVLNIPFVDLIDMYKELNTPDAKITRQYFYIEPKDQKPKETKPEEKIKRKKKPKYIDFLNDNDIKPTTLTHMVNMLLSKSKSTILKYFFCNNPDQAFYKYTSIDETKRTYRTKRTVNYGIDNVCYLNGEIFIPVSDDDIERLRKVSTGHCTLLDNGLVTINGIVEDYDIPVNAKLVGEISTEKTNA